MSYVSTSILKNLHRKKPINYVEQDDLESLLWTQFALTRSNFHYGLPWDGILEPIMIVKKRKISKEDNLIPTHIQVALERLEEERKKMTRK